MIGMQPDNWASTVPTIQSILCLRKRRPNSNELNQNELIEIEVLFTVGQL